jgi:hypothetical protein
MVFGNQWIGIVQAPGLTETADKISYLVVLFMNLLDISTCKKTLWITPAREFGFGAGIRPAT